MTTTPSMETMGVAHEEERTYSGSHNLFRDAAQLTGVELHPQEDLDWGYLMEGASLVDHLLDTEKVSVVPEMRRIGAGTYRPDLHLLSQMHFADYVGRQTEEKLDGMFDQLLRVEELVHAQREATKAREVVEIRVEEADILASFLSLPVGNTVDAYNRIVFNDWLVGFSRAGYLVDSFIDLKKDFVNGESGVKPTARARAVVGSAAVKEGIAALNKTPPKLLKKCGATAVKYVVLNIKPDITSVE